jgi:ketosteroid isomerase-like protein
MRPIRFYVPLLCVLLLPAIAEAQMTGDAAADVKAAETEFAATMADRDLEAFGSFIADEAVFLTGSTLRGSDAIVAAWAEYFEGEDAPFSWAPETVEVLDSGTLALSSGPVVDSAGNRVGTFNSIWRLEPDGRWRVVFDKGCPACACDGK